ncbi:MAG: trypsin-like peptidase domain-containing protein [Novosphingobium sp.]|uniref:trypsin-like peptidase domain-containing protein n=1 Tax=Novosphingobium sp. TaxID=1874826 RepID=UPI003B9DC4BE
MGKKWSKAGKSDDLKTILDRIPWASRGRETPISRLARSVVPVGNKVSVPKGDMSLHVTLQDDAHEDLVMDIQGTAFQAGRGKLYTCWHVIEQLRLQEGEAYILANTRLGGIEAQRPYPFAAVMKYYDMRFDDGGPGIDAGILVCPATDHADAPYEVPPVVWGDSTKLGVGDRVLIGGFPLGKAMFFSNETNRGLIQPSFFEGIISAIIPAIRTGETRLLQISSVALGGISGGVVCDPRTGAVLGMVTIGLTSGDVSLPITYAIPSEVLQPYADAISFDTADGTRWR